ncbi:hypothetical protein M8037_18340, partial [Sinorhizobium meliloti]|uniref:hypothetical protein n=1 Tax=Rhizobium meliloti TaxID=382 RepID=UPI002072AB65
LSHIATQGQMPSACGPILLQKWLLETPPASPPRNQRQTTWQYPRRAYCGRVKSVQAIVVSIES